MVKLLEHLLRILCNQELKQSYSFQRLVRYFSTIYLTFVGSVTEKVNAPFYSNRVHDHVINN